MGENTALASIHATLAFGSNASAGTTYTSPAAAYLGGLGMLIQDLTPTSHGWQAEMYSLRDCRRYLKKTSRSSHRGKARHHADRVAQPLHTPQQFDDGETATGHNDQLACGQPAAYQQQHLPCPIRQLLVSTRTVLILALQRRQYGHKRQRPYARGEDRANAAIRVLYFPGKVSIGHPLGGV